MRYLFSLLYQQCKKSIIMRIEIWTNSTIFIEISTWSSNTKLIQIFWIKSDWHFNNCHAAFGKWLKLLEKKKKVPTENSGIIVRDDENGLFSRERTWKDRNDTTKYNLPFLVVSDRTGLSGVESSVDHGGWGNAVANERSEKGDDDGFSLKGTLKRMGCGRRCHDQAWGRWYSLVFY